MYNKMTNEEMVGNENKEPEDGAISPIIVSTKAKLVKNVAKKQRILIICFNIFTGLESNFKNICCQYSNE